MPTKLALAAAVLLQFIAYDKAQALPVYTPSSAAAFCNRLPADFPSTVPYNDTFLAGNPSCADPATLSLNQQYDVTYDFSLDSADSPFAYSIVTSFEPDGFIASDSGITNGQKIGGVKAGVTLGLLGGTCNTPLTAEFTLYESIAGGTSYAYPTQGSNPFGALVTDSDADGFANSTSPFVAKYPIFYDYLFDPDRDFVGGPNGPLAAAQPLARYTGATKIPSAGGSWQILSLLIFEPSALAPFHADADNRTHMWARAARAPADSRLMVAVLNNPTAAVSSPQPLTDFCTPLSVTAMLKSASPTGQARYRTPTTAGTRSTGTWSYSERDADNDGIVNFLDTCPVTANSGDDTDTDGIDNACDAAYSPGNMDVDSDGFTNRQDNCPQIANAGTNQRESELSVVLSTAAPQGGPPADGIGDACDSQPTIATGGYTEDYRIIAKCIGGTDTDGDGYCAAQDVNDTSYATKGYSLNGGSDMDGVPSGDQFGANVEVYVGTDALKRCDATPDGGTSEAWPADLVESNSINISDVLALNQYFGGTVPNVPQRYDIVPSKTINISDVLALNPLFGTSCVP